MPTYQYACTECDHAFEQFQSFSDESLTTCPSCAGRLRKVFNAVGVVFKGSGFYRTDSRSTGSSSATTDSKSGAAGTSSDSSGSTGSDGGSSSSASSDAASTSSPSTPAPSTAGSAA